MEGGRNESQAVSAVQKRLAEGFADLEPDLVRKEVAAAHSVMTSPIRDFVPVMVQRMARDRVTSRHPEAHDDEATPDGSWDPRPAEQPALDRGEWGPPGVRLRHP